MPVNSHLQSIELKDFSGGLWDKETQLLPPNGLRQMDDCYPVTTGGLRAWYKPSSFTTTGISSVTNERARAIFVHENFTNRSGVGLGNDYYLITYNSVDTVTRLYRMDGTNAEVTWTLKKTFSAGLDPSFVATTAYYTSDGNIYFVFAFSDNSVGGSAGDAGTWYLNYNTGVLTKLSIHGGFIFNYQARLCLAKGSSIGFTDPSVLTNYDTNVAVVDISEGMPGILFCATFSPGDLLVFKEGAPIYLVEGDLNNYTVRQMNGSKPVQLGGPGQAVRGPDGVIFRVGSDGVYATPDGSQIFPLSKALKGSDWQSTAPNAFYDRFLVAFGNGFVLDYDSKAWFNTTFIAANSTGYVLKRNAAFLFATNANPLTLWQLGVQSGATTNRAESYTIKTGPLRDPSGVQIEIREVDVYAQSTNNATSSITVTVNGVAQTVACDSSGRGLITFYFMARREALDVTVTAASNASGVEAPRIETVIVRTRAGHFLTSGADVG